MRKNILFLTIVSFTSLFIMQILLMFLLFTFLEDKPDNNWSVLITNISFIILIWLTQKLFDIKLEFRFDFPKIKIVVYITLLAVCFTISYPILALSNFISDLNRNIIEFTKFDLKINTTSIVYYFNIIFIGPVLEEFYYRKILLHQIEKKYNAFFAIFISSILFSIFHLDYIQCQISFVFGLLSGYLYLKTKKIEITILLHSIINILVIITSNRDLSFDEYYYLLVFYVSIVLLGYFLIIKIIKNVKKK